MDWHRWLIDVPAAIVTTWYRVYWIVLTIATMVAVSTVALMLVLAAFGIRWGW